MTPSAETTSLAGAALPPRPVHLAIGMFDGVHLGHQAVVEAARHSARREGGLAGVLTFQPHPSRLFRPDDPVRQLMTLETKAWFLQAMLGMDFVVAEPFTREFAAVPAEGLSHDASYGLSFSNQACSGRWSTASIAAIAAFA